MGLLSSDIPPAKCFLTITKDDEFSQNLISSHNGSKLVELIVSKEKYESGVKSIIKDVQPLHSYRIKCQLAKFLSNNFLNRWVRRKGVNSIVISETFIDHQDVYAIVNGQLILSLTKNSYERAGLLGQKSKLSNSRYIVRYDLRDPEFYLSKGYQRLIWASENTLVDEVKFIFSIEDILDGDEGIQKEDCNYSKLCAEVREVSRVMTPNFTIPDESSSPDIYKESIQEWAGVCYEWSSLVSLKSAQILTSGKVDPYLSSYSVLDAEDTPTDIVIITWKGGPITNSWILSLWNLLQERSVDNNSWSVLNVYGIEDIPIAWNSKEHTFLVSGENNYSIFKLKDEKSLCLKVVNGKDL